MASSGVPGGNAEGGRIMPSLKPGSRGAPASAGLLPAEEQDAATGAAPARPLGWLPTRRVLAVLVAVVVAALLLAVRLLSAPGPQPLTRADVDRAVQSGIQKAQEQQRDTPPDAATAY